MDSSALFGAEEGLRRALRLVERAQPIAGIRLVGVDGRGGAGKSTFARALAEGLDAPLIEVDDFLGWGDYESWWTRFEEQVLGPLRRGEDARFQQRDRVGDEFGGGVATWRTVPWRPVIVVEGTSATRRAAADAYAVRVWVETPDAERVRRGVERDGEDHRGLWEESVRLEAELFAADPVRDRAHLIVDGTAP